MPDEPTNATSGQHGRPLRRGTTEPTHSDERIARLSLVLRAIRNINQLIVKEKSRDRLLQGACDNLIEPLVCFNAWMAVFDKSGELITAAEAGLGQAFVSMRRLLSSGELTRCARIAMSRSDVVVIEDPFSSCGDCPLSSMYKDRAAMTVRMEHDGRICGLVSVSIPRDLLSDEELALFREVAGDIAFALHAMELDEERKRAEEALKASENRYRTIFETTGAATFIMDEEATIVLANKRFQELSGYSKMDVEGKKSWRDFVARKEGLARMEAFHSMIRTDPNASPKNYEFQFIDRRGSAKDVLATVATIPGKKESVGSLLDISDHKQDKERIAQLNRVLRAIRNVNQLITKEKNRDRMLESACRILVENRSYHNAWISLLNESGGVEKAFEAGLGEAFSPMRDRLEGGSLPDCVSKALTQPGVLIIKEPRIACTDCPLSELYVGRGAMSVRLEHEGIVLGVLTVSVPFAFVEDKEEWGLFEEVADDLSFAIRNLELEKQSKQARERLNEAEKLALVGKLAAGVAHSIRNPLTSVKMRLYSLQRTIHLSKMERDDLEVISEDIDRIDDIIQNFLAFSRPSKPKMQRITPSECVDKSLQLLHPRLKAHGVDVQLHRRQRLPEVFADPEQLMEVLANLLLNACEAMGSGGSVVVREEKDTSEGRGDVAVIHIRDTGPGIPMSVQEKIFQPFFTTKSEGTGLGLSIAARIIQDHGGWLDIESSEGEGTSFSISIPVQEERPWQRS
jgi:PAS domain S-box-containing protein